MSGLESKSGLPFLRDRENYYTFLDSLPIMVWLANERGLCGFANKAALAQLGKTQEEFFATDLMGFVHPDDVVRVAGHLANLSEIPFQIQIEVRMQDNSGEYRWFLSAMIATRDALGRLTGYVGYAVDITESKQATEFLNRTETRYRRLFDSNLIGVTYTNIGGGILDANDKFLKMIGYSAKEIQTHQLRWIDITPPEYKAQMEVNVRELKARGAFDPIEKQYIRKDASRVPVLVASAFLEGSTTDCVTFVVDLTEQKRAEQALRRRADTLAEGQISALSRTLALLATEPSLDTALSHVLKAITEQLCVTSSGLHLINLDYQLHRLAHELPRRADYAGRRYGRSIRLALPAYRSHDGKVAQRRGGSYPVSQRCLTWQHRKSLTARAESVYWRTGSTHCFSSP